MGTTIKDVAREAGVSPSTVSRVIAGSKKISPETTERVKQAMRKLKYYPNVHARNLVTNSTDTVGLVLSRQAQEAFSNPFFPEVLRGITSVSQPEGFKLLFFSGSDHHQEEEEALSLYREKRVAGLILLASRVNDHLIARLRDEQCPFVLVGRVEDDNDIYWVNNDNVQASKNAVDYLLKLKHTRIGMLTGPLIYTVSQDRLQGYYDSLRKKGIEPSPEMVQEVEFTEEGGYEGLKALLRKNSGITAVFAADDTLAIGAMRAAKELDLRIPDDLSIVGFNDDLFAGYVDPPLTTVRIPIFELGRKAMEMLSGLIKGKAVQEKHVVLSNNLIIRKSCTPPVKAY